jgi:hypothetical protein
MLAELVKQLIQYVERMPLENREYDDESVEVIGLKVDGRFERKHERSEDVLIYSGSISAFFVESDQEKGEEVDPYLYSGIRSALVEIKAKIAQLNSEQRTNYELRGLEFNSSNIWFTLERRLSRDAADFEVDQIRKQFPNATETYAT